MDIDYLVSSTSVSFATGASDGTESCITITAICDSEEEGDEAVTVSLPSGSSMYVRNNSGSAFTAFIHVTIRDGKEH